MSNFSGTDRYTQFKYIQNNWKNILIEYTNVKNMMFDWPEHELYTEGWSIVPILFKGNQFKEVQEKCPITMSLINSIPNLVNVGFSILKSGTVVQPHEGYTSEVLRAHLGLICPRGAWIKVGGELKEWIEGELFVFDDTITHEVQNNSDSERVILLFDFMKEDK